MGAVVSSVEGAGTIALWPAVAVADIQGGDMVKGGVGVAAAVGVPYLVFGNPIEIVQKMEPVPIVMFYVAAGVAYWGSSLAVSQIMKTT